MQLQKHIGIALLGCSFVLFLLWAIPYVGVIDTFQFAVSAKDVALAPEHTRLESQLLALQTQYNAKDGGAGIKQLELDVLDTTSHIFEDENPDGELLRGDAAYLAAVYGAALGKPCLTEAAIKHVCAKVTGSATATPSLKIAKEYAAGLKDANRAFTDMHQSVWFSVYVEMLTALEVLNPDLDAASMEDKAFQGEATVTAADVERWFSRIETGRDPAKLQSVPGATLTKKQGVQLLTDRLHTSFAAKAARR